MDELLQRHRKEQRELQGRITQKKKNATKKTRKGVNDECSEMERQLVARQQEEVSALNRSTSPETPNDENDKDTSEDLYTVPYNGPAGHETSRGDSSIDALGTELSRTNATVPASAPKKPNRQKARLARRAAEQEAQAAAAAEEASALPDRRADERAIMQRESAQRGLTEVEVRSDGHCLYAAVADQLSALRSETAVDSKKDFRVVRTDAASFIEAHGDDFSPFLEEPLDSYVKKIRDTAEWGGQLELLALARTYEVRICVLQGDGRVERIESEETNGEQEMWLAYYRHSFGLGEHYNSLRKSKTVAT